jgi:hypothetical protein
MVDDGGGKVVSCCFTTIMAGGMRI